MSYIMKVAGRNLEKPLFSCISCQAISPSYILIEVLGKLLPMRLCSNGSKNQKQQKELSVRSTRSNKVKIGNKIDDFSKSNVTSLSSFPISPLSKTPSRTVLNSMLDFPLFNDVQCKLFMPAEPKKSLVIASSLPIYKPSVFEVLKTTRSPASSENLARWEENNICKLGVEGFRNLTHDLKQEGIDFHNLIKEYLENGDESLSTISPAVEACWKSVTPVLKDIKVVHCMETKVVHPHLMYTGYIDCVATFKSKPVLIEWKKSSRKRSRLDFTYDYPLQLLAYMGAVNFDPAYTFQIKDCLLVLAYTDGSPADVLTVSDREANKYWELWLRRLKQYWVMQEEDSTQNNVGIKKSASSVSAQQEEFFSSKIRERENVVSLKTEDKKTTERNESRCSTQQEKPIRDTTGLTAPYNKLNLESLQMSNVEESSQLKQHEVQTSQSSFPISPLSKTPSRTVLNSMLNFPLFNDVQCKLFMPAEPKNSLVIASSLPIHEPSVIEVVSTTRSPKEITLRARYEKKLILKLGVEGFRNLTHDYEQENIDFHNLIKEYLENGDESLSIISPRVEACWKSIKPVLKDIKVVHCMATKVVHPQLMYTGYIDCIATFKSKPVLIQWKISTKGKRRRSLALLACMGAVNFDPAYTFQIKDCLLVLAYTDGSPAYVLTVSDQEAKMYWELWLRRLKQYWVMQLEDSTQNNVGIKKSASSVSAQQEEFFSSKIRERENVVSLKTEDKKTTERNESRCSTQQEKPIRDTTGLTAPYNKLNLESLQMSNVEESSQLKQHEVQKEETKSKSQKDEGFLKILWKFWKS